MGWGHFLFLPFDGCPIEKCHAWKRFQFSNSEADAGWCVEVGSRRYVGKLICCSFFVCVHDVPPLRSLEHPLKCVCGGGGHRRQYTQDSPLGYMNPLFAESCIPLYTLTKSSLSIRLVSWMYIGWYL